MIRTTVILLGMFLFLAIAPVTRAGSCLRLEANGTYGDCAEAESAGECFSGFTYSSQSCASVIEDLMGPTVPDFSSAQKFSEEAARGAGVDTKSTLESRVASIVNYLLSLIGIIFLMLMVYGGYIWMMARGDEAEATKAKNIITMGVIGMAVVIAAYAISYFVVSRLVAGAS